MKTMDSSIQSPLRRVAGDGWNGCGYTHTEFLDYFGEEGEEMWQRAAVTWQYRASEHQHHLVGHAIRVVLLLLLLIAPMDSTTARWIWDWINVDDSKMQIAPAMRVEFYTQRSAKKNGDHQPTTKKYTTYAQRITHADASYRMGRSALKDNGAEV